MKSIQIVQENCYRFCVTSLIKTTFCRNKLMPICNFFQFKFSFHSMLSKHINLMHLLSQSCKFIFPISSCTGMCWQFKQLYLLSRPNSAIKTLLPSVKFYWNKIIFIFSTNNSALKASQCKSKTKSFLCLFPTRWRQPVNGMNEKTKKQIYWGKSRRDINYVNLFYGHSCHSGVNSAVPKPKSL